MLVMRGLLAAINYFWIEPAAIVFAPDSMAKPVQLALTL